MVVALLMIRAARQRALLPMPEEHPTRDPAPRVSVVIPARNEEANIGLCIESLTKQQYPKDRFQIIVVDDSSTDATANIVCQIEMNTRNLTLLRAPPLPKGWTGKAHACHIGAYACDRRSHILCFIDADVQAHPSLLMKAASMIEDSPKRLLSLVPSHRLITFPERMLIPCGFYALAFLGDLSHVERSRDVRATGQFIMMQQDFYHSIGGHAAVNTAICEDLALARKAQSLGGVVTLADGSQLLSVRLYDGWHSLWLGLTKNLVETLGGPLSALGMAFVAPFLSLASVILPAIYAWDYFELHNVPISAIMITLLASIALFGFHICGALHFRIPLSYGLIFPLGYTIGSIIVLDSLRRRRTGQLVWKGRTY